MARLPNLQYVGVLATGTNCVDGEAARQRGIDVTNVPGYATASVAQHVFALVLELAHGTAAHDRDVHHGGWVGCPDFSYILTRMHELEGRALGIVGLGAIGQRVARIGAAMGMHIAAAHQRHEDVSIPGAPVQWMEHDALFEQADVISLHCPLSERTRGLVSESRLRRMKETAFLINTGRGALVDERALAEALQQGRPAGAGLDVLAEEPPASGNPLLTAPNCVITPHNAWGTKEARQRLMQIAADNIAAHRARRAQHVVN